MLAYWSTTFITLGLVSLIVMQLAELSVEASALPSKRHDTSKYCGPLLSQTLQIICNGSYNMMFKHDEQEMNLGDYPQYDDSHPFRSRAGAMGMLNRYGGGRIRRKTRGIHDECCLKSCTINELRSYCADPL